MIVVLVFYGVAGREMRVRFGARTLGPGNERPRKDGRVVSRYVLGRRGTMYRGVVICRHSALRGTPVDERWWKVLALVTRPARNRGKLRAFQAKGPGATSAEAGPRDTFIDRGQK